MGLGKLLKAIKDDFVENVTDTINGFNRAYCGQDFYGAPQQINIVFREENPNIEQQEAKIPAQDTEDIYKPEREHSISDDPYIRYQNNEGYGNKSHKSVDEWLGHRSRNDDMVTIESELLRPFQVPKDKYYGDLPEDTDIQGRLDLEGDVPKLIAPSGLEMMIPKELFKAQPQNKSNYNPDSHYRGNQKNTRLYIDKKRFIDIPTDQYLGNSPHDPNHRPRAKEDQYGLKITMPSGEIARIPNETLKSKKTGAQTYEVQNEIREPDQSGIYTKRPLRQSSPNIDKKAALEILNTRLNEIRNPANMDELSEMVQIQRQIKKMEQDPPWMNQDYTILGQPSQSLPASTRRRHKPSILDRPEPEYEGSKKDFNEFQQWVNQSNPSTRETHQPADFNDSESIVFNERSQGPGISSMRDMPLNHPPMQTFQNLENRVLRPLNSDK